MVAAASASFGRAAQRRREGGGGGQRVVRLGHARPIKRIRLVSRAIMSFVWVGWAATWRTYKNSADKTRKRKVRKHQFRIQEIKWKINSTMIVARGEPKGTNGALTPMQGEWDRKQQE